MKLSSQIGLEKLSIGSLAQTVGMSKSGLFAHFSSKEALQLSVIDNAVQHFISNVIAPSLREPRGEPRVRSLLSKWLDWSRSDSMPGGCIFVAAATELDDQPGPVRDRLVEAQKDWLGVLVGAARTAVEEGHFSADSDLEQFAYESYALALGYQHLSRLLDDPSAEGRLKVGLEALFARFRA